MLKRYTQHGHAGAQKLLLTLKEPKYGEQANVTTELTTMPDKLDNYELSPRINLIYARLCLCPIKFC